MVKVISIHSFRRGTGKTHLAANLAVLLAGCGKRVAVMDTALLSPGIHHLFKLVESDMAFTLTDYIFGRCEIEQTIYDLTSYLKLKNGCLFLIPASTKPVDIIQLIKDGYDYEWMNHAVKSISQKLGLDFLILDTYSGINDAAMLSFAISDKVVVVFRLDQQDYLGTGVVLDLAHHLSVPKVLLAVNQVPDGIELESMVRNVRQNYNQDLVVSIPYSDALMSLGSSDVFSVCFPEHPLTEIFKHLAKEL